MAYSKPLSFSFHKQEDFASVFTFNNTTLPLSTMRDSPFPELSSSPKSRFPTIPSPTNTSPFPSPFPKANGTTLAKYTDHSSHALPGECITECKICKTLYGLDIAAFYWSLMAMYGLPYRSPVSPPLPSDVRAKSPMGSACSDSQPPSPASSTGEEIGKESAIYRCNVCQKTYSHPRFLNRHLQSHTPFKKHHCPRCGKGFNDAFDLKRHIRTHTGVKPFKCNLCDKSFTQRCSLEAHSTRVHGVAHKFSFRERRPKVYVCEECGITFHDNSKFRQHSKEHGSCAMASQIINFK
ncbi:putative transcription factor ovo-like protein 3 [Rhopilema esculentum]|uniref:putative transcription factor ovo-like protein 3 n=1 Tax=Rhopilema esculentum TaxID=499914 RepID=UPI0031DD459F